jgi:hypothetical protein
MDGIKMHDAAEKPLKMELEEEKAPDGPCRPCVYFNTRQLPELKGKEIGDEFYVVQLVKVKGVNIRESKDKEEANYDLEIQEVGLKEKDEKKGLDLGNYKNSNSL